MVVESSFFEGRVYDLKLVSTSGNESSAKGIYLGDNFGKRGKLHGMVFFGDSGLVHLIKFSHAELLTKNSVRIRSPTRMYGLEEEKETQYKRMLKEAGL